MPVERLNGKASAAIIGLLAFYGYQIANTPELVWEMGVTSVLAQSTGGVLAVVILVVMLSGAVWTVTRVTKRLRAKQN